MVGLDDLRGLSNLNDSVILFGFGQNNLFLVKVSVKCAGVCQRESLSCAVSGLRSPGP